MEKEAESEASQAARATLKKQPSTTDQPGIEGSAPKGAERRDGGEHKVGDSTGGEGGLPGQTGKSGLMEMVCSVLASLCE